MTHKSDFNYIKSKILELTNNLEIIDELSKDRENEELLQKILFKTKNNHIFIEQIRGKNSIYSTKTLARIAFYNEYPRLIKLLSTNFNLTYETTEYLFENYQNNIEILQNLEKNAPYNLKIQIQNHLAMLEYNSNTNTLMNDAFERLRS